MLKLTESRSKPRRLLTSVFVSIALLGASAHAQTNLSAYFSTEQVAVLEQLVTFSEASSPTVLEAQRALGVASSQQELGTRLVDSLSVRVGTGLSGDVYGQFEPTYSISAGVDIMKLVSVEDRTPVLQAQLSAARAENRARVASAYVGYVVAQEAAEAAAHGVDSASAAFEVVKARVQVGEATLSDQLAAQSAVSSSALALLTANSNVIISLEQLAATVGRSPETTLAVVNGTQELAGQ